MSIGCFVGWCFDLGFCLQFKTALQATGLKVGFAPALETTICVELERVLVATTRQHDFVAARVPGGFQRSCKDGPSQSSAPLARVRYHVLDDAEGSRTPGQVGDDREHAGRCQTTFNIRDEHRGQPQSEKSCSRCFRFHRIGRRIIWAEVPKERQHFRQIGEVGQAYRHVAHVETACILGGGKRPR